VEARNRIVRLLQGRRAGQAEQHRSEKAIRVLEYSNAPEARKALEELARGSVSARSTQAARAALKRLDRAPGRVEVDSLLWNDLDADTGSLIKEVCPCLGN
jgi:hypothetical protein